jgi:hypothetical protein
MVKGSNCITKSFGAIAQFGQLLFKAGNLLFLKTRFFQYLGVFRLRYTAVQACRQNNANTIPNELSHVCLYP